MLTLEISLPSPCETKRVDVCEEFDATVYVGVRLCIYCGGPFIWTRKNHRVCWRRRCRKNAYPRKKGAHCAPGVPSKPLENLQE